MPSGQNDLFQAERGPAKQDEGRRVSLPAAPQAQARGATAAAPHEQAHAPDAREKSVAKRVQQAMDLLQTGAMQFADVHGTGASIIFTERDGTFEVEIKRGDDDDATQD